MKRKSSKWWKEYSGYYSSRFDYTRKIKVMQPKTYEWKIIKKNKKFLTVGDYLPTEDKTKRVCASILKYTKKKEQLHLVDFAENR